ncbi:PqqD family protein [Hoylesella enoeca]|uniref:PqqD family protein n=1 Tax=Hoylesella enoeca TaxID=76123 RepID=A0A0S2KIC0_9BACT|nr:PqqD family protein [Hoylesella enoeca]ALO48043.1 hypothetical protein AS203_02160 [Hoylesella enoeca]
MKAKKGFNLRTICGRQIIVAEGEENIDFSNIITMNETSAFLWKQIGNKEFTTDDLVRLLTTHYEVSEEEARKDVTELIEQFLKIGIIEA